MKRPKINEKEAEDGPFFLKETIYGLNVRTRGGELDKLHLDFDV